MDVSLGELQELAMDREAWRAAIYRVTKSQTQLSDWTEQEYLDKTRCSIFDSPFLNKTSTIPFFHL